MRAMGPSASVRTVPGVRRKRVRGCHLPQGCPRTVTWLCGFAWKRHAWGMCARMQRVCARFGTAGSFGIALLVHPSFLTPVDICPDHQGGRMGLASCARALCARHAKGAAHGSSRRSHPRMVAGGSGGGGGGSGGGRQRAAKVSG